MGILAIFRPGLTSLAFGLTDCGICLVWMTCCAVIGCYFLDQVSSGTAWQISFSQSWMLVWFQSSAFFADGENMFFFLVTKTPRNCLNQNQRDFCFRKCWFRRVV